jgi:hypothetical protein
VQSHHMFLSHLKAVCLLTVSSQAAHAHVQQASAGAAAASCALHLRHVSCIAVLRTVC